MSVVAEAADDVVQAAAEQRWPAPGEPACVVCARYAEYVCDATDADVCSRECKLENLRRSAANVKAKESSEARLRREHGISVDGNAAGLGLVEAFDEAELPEVLLENLRTRGFEWPTPVQMQIIPIVQRGLSVLATSSTGSGKTAAFLIPLLADVARYHKVPGIKAVVMAPTRELCVQIDNECKSLATSLSIRTALLVGGRPIKPQMHRLTQGVEVIVATPGRLIDVLTRKPDVSLDDVKFLVVDEVDAMLTDPDFLDAVLTLKRALNTHQTLLFSATSSTDVERIAAQVASPAPLLNVNVAGRGKGRDSACKEIFIWTEEPSKRRKLFEILWSDKYWRPPLIIFVNSKVGASLLAGAITSRCEVEARPLHGDLAQAERTETLRAFAASEFPVLVATNVVGRGIDLHNVKMVVNFDMAPSLASHIHRIGRCGRDGRNGLALTLLNDSNESLFGELREYAQQKNIHMPAEFSSMRRLRPSKRQRRHR